MAEITIKKYVPPAPDPREAQVEHVPPGVVIPTAEELLQRTTDFYESAFGEKPSPEAAKKIIEPLKKTEGPAPATPTEPGAPAPEPAELEPEPEPEPTARELIARTASVTAQAVATEMRRSAPPAPRAEPAKPKGPDLGPEDQSDYEAMLYLERTDPKNWSGKPQQFLDYVQKLQAYAEKWVQDNPDKEFEITGEDHEQWMADNKPDLDLGAIDQAKVDIRAELKAEQKIEPLKQRLKEADAQKAFQDNFPTIVQNVNRSVLTMLDKTSPEFGKIFKDEKGNPVFNAENEAKLDDLDPIAKKVIDQLVLSRLKPMLLEVEKSVIPEMNYKLNAAGNPAHAEIDRHRQELEADFMRLPEDQRQWDGKKFLTISQMNVESQAIMNGPGTKEERDARLQDFYNTHWSVSADQLEERIAENLAAEARQIIADLDAPAKKKYARAATPAVPSSQPAPAPRPAPAPIQPATPAPRPASSRPPSISTQSDMTTAPERVQGGTKTPGQVAADVMFQ